MKIKQYVLRKEAKSASRDLMVYKFPQYNYLIFFFFKQWVCFVSINKLVYEEVLTLF